MARSVAERAEALFRAHRLRIFTRTDRMFVVLMLVQWLAAIAIAAVVSPRVWAGAQSHAHTHVWIALLLGGVITLVPVGLGLLRSGETSTRHAIAVGQVLMSSLLIHLTGGRTETHFHVFGSLAFLAFYRDAWLFLPATVAVAADHYLRGVYWPESVFGVADGSWRWIEHSGWVVFEDAFLVCACLQSVRAMRDVAHQGARIEYARERTEATVKARSADLEASESLFRSLSAAAPIGIVVTDPQGKETYNNERWSEITGMSSDEARGDGWMHGVHPDDLAALLEVRETSIREQRELEAEFRYVTPWGVRWVHARVRPLRAPDGTMIGRIGTVEDVTARRQADEEREEEGRISRVLVDVARALLSSLEKPVMMERLCTETASALGADYSTTWLRLRDEDVYTARATYGLAGVHWEALRTVRFPLQALSGADRTRLVSGEVVVVRNAAGSSVRLLDMFARHGAMFVLCIPLLRGGALVGAQVGGFRDRTTTLTPARERIARGIGQLASMALANVLLYDEATDAIPRAGDAVLR
ncbi:MAG TPA: PAS domain S-box protein [Candidatus Binatia bacterium]|jgi:PAS domain S-box-containing protein